MTASARRIGFAPLSGKTTAKTELSEAGALKAKSSNFWSLDMTADIEKEGFNPSARKAAPPWRMARRDTVPRLGCAMNAACSLIISSMIFALQYGLMRRYGTNPIPNLRALKALDR